MTESEAFEAGRLKERARIVRVFREMTFTDFDDPETERQVYCFARGMATWLEDGGHLKPAPVPGT